MYRLPSMVFITDVRREHIAVKEANKLDVPIIGMVDTNCDPTPIDHIIPSNDDAIRAIKLIADKFADAVIEGQQIREALLAEEEEEVREAREEWGEYVVEEELPMEAEEPLDVKEMVSEMEVPVEAEEFVSDEEMSTEAEPHFEEGEADASDDSSADDRLASKKEAGEGE